MPERLTLWFRFLAGTVGVGAALVLFARSVPPSSIAFAFWVNVFLMVWAVLIRAGALLRLPPGYFAVSSRELRLHRLLGVPAARKLFRRLPTNAALKLRGRRDLARLERETRSAETGHLLVFAAVTGFAFWAGLRYGLRVALPYAVFNLFLNGYPVLVQRHNRARIWRIQRMALLKNPAE